MPLFISHRILKKRRTFPRAKGRWALDSGGFSELSLYGKWETSPSEYLLWIQNYEKIGNLDWAAPQDWMCEPFMLEKTGLSIEEHQRRTIESVQELRAASNTHIIPVLQGWEQADYHRHWKMYEDEGFDLESEPTVGIGSVCRRQHTKEGIAIIQSLAPLRLHGFGLKITALKHVAGAIKSADSMAWSFTARRLKERLPGHTHQNCANCLEYALKWREDKIMPILRERKPL